MGTMIIRSNPEYTVDVSVGEYDGYSESVQVKVVNNLGFGEVTPTHEMFLTPKQMDLLGRFLIRQADEIQTAQSMKGKL